MGFLKELRFHKTAYGSPEFWDMYTALSPRHREIFANLVHEGMSVEEAVEHIKSSLREPELKE